jgi:serine/threonine protein kinase
VDARFCNGCGRPLDDGAAPLPATSLEAVTIAATPPAAGRPPVSDRYELVRFLGEGGTKRVYLARDRRLDRLVAIGVLKQQHLDTVGRARLDREAKAMAALGDHPNIVTLHDIEELGDQVYIVCQFMDSGSLADALARRDGRPYDLPDALGIGVQIAEALAHAHRAGIVHRDVKPGNVWLRSGGGALLGDFGLARLGGQATQITTEGSMLGTAAYMPPEQALGKDPEPASDLYSLGCMLYELITARRPFAGDDPVAVISQHLHADPAPPSFHRPELPAALDRAVELDDGLPYDEPWGWMQPTRHALGALLSEQGRYDEAEAIYRADLGLDGSLRRACQHPDNVWSLHGLHECLARRGDTIEAPLVKQRLDLALARTDVPVEASCYCRQT